MVGHGKADIAAGFAPPLYAARAITVVGAATPPAATMLLHAEQEFHFSGRLALGADAPLRWELVDEGDYGFHHAVRLRIDVGTAVSMITTVVVGRAQGTGRLPLADRPATPRATIAEASTVLPVDLPRRYAAASGDHNPIHLDDAAARAAGLPGVIVHGMATLAIAAGLAARCAEIGSSPIRSLRARMARPVLPGAELRTAVARTSDRSRCRLRVLVDGLDVLKDVELRTEEPS